MLCRLVVCGSEEDTLLSRRMTCNASRYASEGPLTAWLLESEGETPGRIEARRAERGRREEGGFVMKEEEARDSGGREEIRREER